jgi:hypothetical protein
MSQNKTRFGRKAVLDHFFGRINYAFPANVYLALFTDDPTDLGLLTDELTSSGYARVEISALMSDAVLASGQITNSAQILFGPAGVDWPAITHCGIMDAATIGTGNMIYFGPAVTSRTVESGDSFIIRIGQLTIIEK